MTDILERTNEPWTENEVQQLLTLYEAGLSCSKIAAHIGTGKTRNAVIGKLHRLGLTNSKPTAIGEPKERPRPPRPVRTSPSMPRVPQRLRLVKPEVEIVPLIPPVPARKAGEPITVVTLEPGMCKFPIGDPQHKDFHFCGTAQRDGAPYCPFHCEVAFNDSQTNQRLRKSTSEASVRKAIRR